MLIMSESQNNQFTLNHENSQYNNRNMFVIPSNSSHYTNKTSTKNLAGIRLNTNSSMATGQQQSMHP